MKKSLVAILMFISAQALAGPSPEDVECLALNIYHEARGEPLEGQLAVGFVTLNRVKSSRYPDTVCGVVWEKRKNRRGRWVPQFSWTLDGRSDKPEEALAWKKSQLLANVLLENEIQSFVADSMNYHANTVDPGWSRRLTPVAALGSHIFYVSP